MKQIAFIGGTDKLDTLIYVGSIISGTEGKKQTLIVDFTKLSKSKYVVPTLEEKDRYVTTYHQVDVAVGYTNFNQLLEDQVIMIDQNGESNYKYILFDMDQNPLMYGIQFTENDLIFAYTNLDIYSLNILKKAFEELQLQIPVSKVILSKRMKRADIDYVNYMVNNPNLIWSQYIIMLPYENGDQSVIFENQRAQRFNLKPFSSQFKKGLENLSILITNGELKGISSYMRYVEKT